METTAAYALYSENVEVAEVVRALNAAGFESESICLMFASTHPVAALVKQANMLSHEREASAATAEWIRWLSDLGAVVIPTVGFFIRSAVFLHALVLAKEAPAMCGSSQTLASLGFSACDAERFEEQLQRGYLVYVASVEIGDVSRVLEVLRLTGAEQNSILEKEASAKAVA